MRNQNPPRGGFTFCEVVIVLAILVILAAILFPFFGRARESCGPPSCQSHLKQIGLGFKQYIQDYNEKYPPVGDPTNAPGWVEVLQPYLKSTQIFQCPNEGTAPQSDPTQPQYTDYWFNARMAGQDESWALDPAKTLEIGDGNDGSDLTDARYHMDSIPQKWRDDTSSPLHRHLEAANLAFVDGHVKAAKAHTWQSNLSTSEGYTFEPAGATPTN